jgi:hypothetical protein
MNCWKEKPDVTPCDRPGYLRIWTAVDQGGEHLRVETPGPFTEWLHAGDTRRSYAPGLLAD